MRALRTVIGCVLAIAPAWPRARPWARAVPRTYRTANAGDRWRVARGPRNVATVAVSTRQRREVTAATTERLVFRSLDGGVTWRQQR